MDKLVIVARQVLGMVSLLLFVAVQTGWSHTSALSEKTYKPSVPRFSEEDIIERLENISSVIDINYTYEVGRRIKEYTVTYRKAGEKILGRVDLYFPLFEKEIHKRKLPEELKYVAVVESNLVPTATSSLGATGLWQFMSATGRMKGLKINSVIDERRDPVKSTSAALDYLTDLYCEFDDWTLAIAAYNCGPGNVRKAIRRGGSYNFWEIRRFLPRETQNYVPRIIAAMYLMQYYHYHKLTPELVDEDMKYTVQLNDGKKHNLYELSRDLEIPYRTVRKLNPQFKSAYVPKNNGDLTIVIPRSKYEDYLKTYDEEAYHDLIDQRRKSRIKRMAEIQKIMENNKVKPLQNIEEIQPRPVYSAMTMQEAKIDRNL